MSYSFSLCAGVGAVGARTNSDKDSGHLWHQKAADESQWKMNGCKAIAGSRRSKVGKNMSTRSQICPDESR